MPESEYMTNSKEIQPSFLIIDDDIVNVEILKRILKSSGSSNISFFYSAEDALNYLVEKVKIKKYRHGLNDLDVIITDLMMPNMDGIQFCEAVKKIKEYEHVPIIMVTASDSQEDLTRAFEVGVMDYISKPFSRTEVLARINSALKLKREADHRIKKEYELLEELRIAQSLQRSLLPQPIDLINFKINGIYIPQSFLGGDLYYWEKLDEHRYGVIMLDVMGHGTATALICMYLRALIPRVFKEFSTIENCIKVLEQDINDFNETAMAEIEYNFSAFFMVIDLENKSLEYINAGHPDALAILPGGRLEKLSTGYLPIGLKYSMTIEKGYLAWDTSLTIFIYTDGLSDTFMRNKLNLENEIVKVMYPGSSKSANEIMTLILGKISQVVIKDDISILMIEIKEEEKELKEFYLKITPTWDEVTRADEFIGKALSEVEFYGSFQISFAIHELVINSVEALKADPLESIELFLKADKDNVEFILKDRAGGLKNTSIEILDNTNFEDILEEESGRGLLLVKHLTDSFEHYFDQEGKAVYKICKRGNANE